jgi:hypothetical protein
MPPGIGYGPNSFGQVSKVNKVRRPSMRRGRKKMGVDPNNVSFMKTSKGAGTKRTAKLGPNTSNTF